MIQREYRNTSRQKETQSSRKMAHCPSREKATQVYPGSCAELVSVLVVLAMVNNDRVQEKLEKVCSSRVL